MHYKRPEAIEERGSRMPKRALSPIWFALIAGAFFLPFVTISCQAPAGLGDLGDLGGEAGQIPSGGFEISATGWDLVTGAEPEVSGDPSFTDQLGQGGLGEQSEPSTFAIIAFGAAVLGIVLSLLRDKIGGIIAIILGAVAAVSLFLLRNDISGDLPQEAASFLTIKYGIGYWLALVFAIVAAAWGVLRVMSRDTAAMPPPAAAGAPMATGAPPPPTGGTGFESGAPPAPPMPPPAPPQEPTPPA
jgi:hypothetical protein